LVQPSFAFQERFFTACRLGLNGWQDLERKIAPKTWRRSIETLAPKREAE
jgi:hypothetical protein